LHETSNNINVESRSTVGEKPWYSATISAYKPVEAKREAAAESRSCC
jgi:hypothetical protein